MEDGKADLGVGLDWEGGLCGYHFEPREILYIG